MEAKTLQSIKDEIAINHGYDGWEDVITLIDFREISGDKVNEIVNEAAKIYAKLMVLAACEKQREICAENAKAKKEGQLEHIHFVFAYVDKASILNAPLAITID